MKNNIVIEIPSTKKEVLRVPAYCRVSTASILYSISAIMRDGYLHIYPLSII
ncbi:hypothetical protein DFR58_13728 [Anaerobacterium chartisolvens]|uniref:Uncharacterized protein n=1 Tax=Anaerobacterium chartisolvens TaxID=1297424 RepID=A0A369AIW3_9FIRM|nr:hypothetical protein [Anaerobacterium chartisolvens]RCX09312.1 hypothetical protein DFR58_13728 [Anaerobacterium chartisolvens]